ncbi:hypothetical protein ACQYAD_04735 [Neobacillus sp. SM06]
MPKKNQFPPRTALDESFHFLQDQITRIAVEEEQEMIKEERASKGEKNES